MLTLKRTYESPPVGPWSDYDYDVFDGDQRVGRIMLAQQTPEGRPWFWMTARVLQSMDDHGYAASREHAMADFEARWEALHPRQIPLIRVPPPIPETSRCLTPRPSMRPPHGGLVLLLLLSARQICARSDVAITKTLI